MIQGEKIKQRREALGLTQQELADKLYVTVQAVSQWENGKAQPDSDRILLLAKLLGTTAVALLHDVCEDSGVKPAELPFSSPMRTAVSLLTKDPECFLEAGRAAALGEYCSGIHGNQPAIPSQIDLHMHSTASDGTDSPTHLAEKAKAAGIRVFALTDHDTVNGVEQLAKQLPKGMTFIPGIEFSCRMVSGKCHILGYSCNTAHPAFQNALAQGAALRKAKLEKRLDFLRDKGMCFPEEELDRLRQIPGVGKPHLGNLMVRYGYAPDKQTAITQFINRCPTGSSRILADTAVKAILSSGGVPVWAHPLGGEGEKEIGTEQFAIMLDELTGYGLMGMECWYSKYPISLCEKLAETADKHRLLISGGSDYHGTNKAIPPGILNADGQEVPAEQITILEYLLKRGMIYRTAN